MDIQPFNHGPKNAIIKLNEVIAKVNSLVKMTGDRFIRVSQNPIPSVSLNKDALFRELPKNLGSEIYRAKLTADAGTATTITANIYLGGVEQTAGNYSGVTVYCRVHPSANLNSALPLLSEDEEINVVRLQYMNGTTLEQRWYCTSDFYKADICD